MLEETCTKQNWIIRLAGLTTQLGELHRELAQVLEDERRTKAKAWLASEGESVNMRDRIASYEALEAICERHRIEGEIAALKEEQTQLLTLIAHAPPS